MFNMIFMAKVIISIVSFVFGKSGFMMHINRILGLFHLPHMSKQRKHITLHVANRIESIEINIIFSCTHDVKLRKHRDIVDVFLALKFMALSINNTLKFFLKKTHSSLTRSFLSDKNLHQHTTHVSVGFGSSAFVHCSYSVVNLVPSQPFDRDLMAQI
jgi:hypothetical protein